jgi:hypothetical protein
MSLQTGNLSAGERAISAMLAVACSVIAMRRGAPWLRAAAGIAGASLLTRSLGGHCAVKAALQGHTSLRDGLTDQWRSMRTGRRPATDGLPGSPVHAATSRAVDEAVLESFPASDPPASRLPDEPPINAEAKWEAARKRGPIR